MNHPSFVPMSPDVLRDWAKTTRGTPFHIDLSKPTTPQTMSATLTLENITVTIEEITPSIAAAMLKQNVSNRPISKGHVKYLAKEMSEERFGLNGDTIVFADDRSLMNGQHRLHAVIASGKTVRVLIVRGIPRAFFPTYDTQRKRNGADILSSHSVSNAKHVSAALGVVDIYLKKRTPNYRHSPFEIEQLFLEHPNIVESVTTWSDTKKLLHNRIAAGLHYLFATIDREAADDFFESLISGENLDRTSPIYLLRERLISNRMSRSKLHSNYISALIIKTWNAHRRGQSIGTLKHQTGEPTPAIEGLK
jgi:hypothetical protein